jgi:AcrR family transcriptional regulator
LGPQFVDTGPQLLDSVSTDSAIWRVGRVSLTPGPLGGIFANGVRGPGASRAFVRSGAAELLARWRQRAILFASMELNPTSTPTQRAAPGREDGRLRRGRRSRRKIREAARALFQERGFDAATLREIGARAGMGASSIYRHVASKHELLILELADLQEEAWTRFRQDDNRKAPTRERIRNFFASHHALLAQTPDLTVIAIRATTYPEARVARRVLALNDRAIGLLAEILLGGRMLGDLSRHVDVLIAGQTLFHAATGARVAWANGLLDEVGCREAIEASVDLLFAGLGSAPVEPSV